MMPMSTLMMLMPFPKIRITMCSFFQPSYVVYVRMGLQSILKHLNWPSRKLTVLDTGLHREVLRLGKKAILHIDHPCNATELRMFIGCINYYHDMWPSCAHILKPLTDNSGLKKHAPTPWTDDMQKVFNKMRALMAADVMGCLSRP